MDKKMRKIAGIVAVGAMLIGVGLVFGPKALGSSMGAVFFGFLYWAWSSDRDDKQKPGV